MARVRLILISRKRFHNSHVRKLHTETRLLMRRYAFQGSKSKIAHTEYTILIPSACCKYYTYTLVYLRNIILILKVLIAYHHFALARNRTLRKKIPCFRKNHTPPPCFRTKENFCRHSPLLLSIWDVVQ